MIVEDQGIEQRAIVCQILIRIAYSNVDTRTKNFGDNFNESIAIDRILSLDLDNLPKIGDIITHIDDEKNVTNWSLKKGG